MAFEPASSAANAEWVSSALRRGSWTRVSAVIPNLFEAYTVLREFKPPFPKSWRERFFHWLLTLRWRLFGSKYEFRAYAPPKKKS